MSETELVEKALKIVARPPISWLDSWRQLAALTGGIPKTDARYHPVLAALARCDVAFEHDDWPAFQETADAVKRLVHGA